MDKYKYAYLYSIMKKKHDSQIKVGKLLGVSDLTIRKKLAGKTDWTISEINKLCKHYKKDFYELFKTED